MSVHEFVSFLLLIFSFNLVSQIGSRVLFQFACIFRDFLCVWVHGQLWRKFYEVLRRRYILLCFCEMFCKNLWGPFALWQQLPPAILCLIFLDGLSIGKSGVIEVTLYHCEREDRYVIFAVVALFMNSGTLLYGAQTLRIAISFCWIFPLSVLVLSYLFLVVLVGNLFCLVLRWLHWLAFWVICLEFPFFIFHPEVMSIFDVKVCFLKAVALCICLFVGELRPFMLRIINEQCLMISILLLLMWGVFLHLLIGWSDMI